MTAEIQMQCPNCGAYKVSVWKPPTGPVTVMETLPEAIFWALVIVFTLGFGLLIAVPVLIYNKRQRQKQLESGDTSWKCTCSICGYAWSWMPGTPCPSATVRPDLIAAGEQKNREDEERRRRLNDD